MTVWTVEYEGMLLAPIHGDRKKAMNWVKTTFTGGYWRRQRYIMRCGKGTRAVQLTEREVK